VTEGTAEVHVTEGTAEVHVTEGTAEVHVTERTAENEGKEMQFREPKCASQMAAYFLWKP
jgi:hypothetical protein